MWGAFDVPLGWGELLKRTFKEVNEDDCLGLAAQLAYYFFLSLFPAILFVLAVASFFPLSNFIDEVIARLGPFAPPAVLQFLEEQLRRISNNDNGGLLTLGILGAIWSSSAALAAIINTLNRAYDIDEGRPWWKVRVIAIVLTIALAIFMVTSFTLIVAGPSIAEYLARVFWLGPVFEWGWKILQWPLAFVLASTAIGIIYFFGPDAEQEWVWITPGAVLGTLLWVGVSLGFKFYVSNFQDYNATYGAVGAVIVLLLWFYISALAILVGAELNAEIEHASPHGKAPGEKVPGEKKKIGLAAARAFRERLATGWAGPRPVSMRVRRFPRQTKEHAMAPHTEERTLGQMFAELTRETRTLVQQEIQLAKAELTQKAAKMGRGAAALIAGGVIAYGGVLAIVASLVLGLVALGLSPWAAALLGGVLVVAVGYVLVRSGLSRLRAEDLKPQQTIESLKEDVQWLRTQAKS